MSTSGGFACTLDPDGLRDRAGQLHQLARRLRGRSRDAGGARLHFDPAAVADVRRFVADESACCSFFDFDVRQSDVEVVLAITAPSQAEPLLDLLVAGFDPTWQVDQREAAIGRLRGRGRGPHRLPAGHGEVRRGRHQTLVVAPTDAELTVRAYFARTPRV